MKKFSWKKLNVGEFVVVAVTRFQIINLAGATVDHVMLLEGEGIERGNDENAPSTLPK